MNLALIGCGAIAQHFYAEALRRHRCRFDRLWLVDPNAGAAERMQARIHGQPVAKLSEIGAQVDAAIISTPNAWHYPLAMEALARGAHVLVEKPIVTEPDQARQLIAAAERSRRIVAVNQTRRLSPVAQQLRSRIRQGEFGALKSVVHREGTKLMWPFESGAAFAPGSQRTGVIMDFGVHVVDLYEYLLAPEWALVSATHDGFAGPEGLAEIALQADGAPVSILLSRYYPQENVARMVFDKAEVRFGVYDADTFTLRVADGETTIRATPAVGGDPADRLILNFLECCNGQGTPVCEAASSLPVIDILDTIYRGATLYPARLGMV